MNQERVMELNEACLAIRQDILRMAKAAGDSGLHFGGSLSMVEIAAALYLEVLNISPDMLCAEERDRLIISKGHGVPAVYAAMRLCGIISPEELDTFKQDDTRLYGHPCMNPEIGIEYSTGSLGQGLSLAVGAALALRRKQNTSSRLFVILGDGECDEGSVWEAAMSASHYRLNRIVAIIDRNRIQYDGNTETVVSLESLRAKWESFGWEVREIDGHDVAQCCEAFSAESDRPIAVIANTVKGKGISFMENDPAWHFKKMTSKQMKLAMEELGYAGT